MLSGLVGVGGGIIFVPALVYVAGWSIGDATAASFMIIIFSSLSGVLRNTSGESPVNWRAAALLVATVAPASLIGVAINRLMFDDAVKIIFALVLLSFTYPLLSHALGKKENGGTPARRIPPAVVLLGGVAIGTLSGLVGVGRGVVMVPLMILGLDVRPKSAIATSLIVVLCTGVVAAVGYVVNRFPAVLGAPAAHRRLHPRDLGRRAHTRPRPGKATPDRVRGVHDDSSGPAPDQRRERLLGARRSTLLGARASPKLIPKLAR